MKKITIIIAISICFIVASCKKSEFFYCVKTIQNSPTNTTLSKSEMDVIKYLFELNDLDYTKYQFYQFRKDELGHHHIRCYQFANNLKVFTGSVTFHFDENDFQNFLSGRLVNTVDLDTKPSMDINIVVEKFISAMKQDKDPLFKNTEKFDKDCFDVEFGYYDLNAGTSYSDEKYTKAWRIQRTNKGCPFAYINDENSDIIYYDNCIRY